MRKTSTLLLAMLLSVVLMSACNKSDEKDDKGTASVGDLFGDTDDTETTGEIEIISPDSTQCAQVDRPVCAPAVSGEEPKTYLNACEAEKAGAARWTSGKCQ